MRKAVQIVSAVSLLALGGLTARADTAAPDPAASAHVDFYRGNAGHTGVFDDKLTAPLSLLWRHTTRAAKNDPASLVYANRTAYFASGGFLYAVNAGDGTLKWQYPANGKATTFFATTPALAGGFLYVTDDNGQVYKMDAATGAVVWTVKLDSAIRSAPVVSGGVVYFGSGNSHCYALSADTGGTVWDVTTGGAVTTSPVLAGGLVVFASSDNSIYGLSGRSGHKAWSQAFDVDPSTLPLAFDGRLLYVSAGDTITSLDPADGGRRARVQLPTLIAQPPAVSSDSLYVIAANNTLYALTTAGRERWRAPLGSAAMTPPVLAGTLLVTVTQPGILSGYDGGSGRLLWRYVVQASATDSQPQAQAANVLGAPIVAGGALYVVSDDGSLSAFRPDAPDDIGPLITQRVPDDGSYVKGAGLNYGAFLADEGSGIDPSTVSLQLDGQPDPLAHYHLEQNAVYAAAATSIADGPHQITVKATDWRGNATAETWSFTVGDRPQRNRDRPGLNPNDPNYPGRGGRDPNAPPPPPPIGPL